MIDKIEEFLKKYNIKNQNVIIGCSAGPDSVALSCAISFLKDKYNLKIILAYFNHNWRIEEAKKEEIFCKELAEKIDADCVIDRACKNAKKNEETARKLRYDFFEACAKKYNSKTVMLAHNKNDNIETLIYRIIKGTSIAGLTSIPENRDIYFRPFLSVEKKEILDFLNKINQPYLIDSSNFDVVHKRNLIRKEILPLFEKINPNYINSIDNLIKNSIASRKIIDKSLIDVKKSVFIEDKIIRSKFILLNREYRFEVLNDFLGAYLKNRDFKTISRFDDFILNNSDKKVSLNSNNFLKIKNDFIFIVEKKEKINDEILINGVGEYNFLNLTFKIEKCSNLPVNFPASSDNCCYLSFDEDIFPLKLRHRKNGDIFIPLGLKNGKMKLKDYLINQKIPQEKRDELVLLCKDNDVLWVLGEKIGEKYKFKSTEGFYLSYFKKGEL